jgi:hypothetical protein
MFDASPFQSEVIPRSGENKAVEDFLRIKIICLVIVLGCLTVQQAQRLQLAQKRPDSAAASGEEFTPTWRCQLPDPGDGNFAVLDGQPSQSLVELSKQIEGLLNDSPQTQPKVLISASKDRSLGDFEDVQDAFAIRGFQIQLEFEVRK